MNSKRSIITILSLIGLLITSAYCDTQQNSNYWFSNLEVAIFLTILIGLFQLIDLSLSKNRADAYITRIIIIAFVFKILFLIVYQIDLYLSCANLDFLNINSKQMRLFSKHASILFLASNGLMLVIWGIEKLIGKR